MNRNLKTHTKMVTANGTADMETEDGHSPPPERMPMCSSAYLAEKLKKLMETPLNIAKAMDCKLDKLKKKLYK